MIWYYISFFRCRADQTWCFFSRSFDVSVLATVLHFSFFVTDNAPTTLKLSHIENHCALMKHHHRSGALVILDVRATYAGGTTMKFHTNLSEGVFFSVSSCLTVSSEQTVSSHSELAPSSIVDSSSTLARHSKRDAAGDRWHAR